MKYVVAGIVLYVAFGIWRWLGPGQWYGKDPMKGKTGAQLANELRDWNRDYGPGMANTNPATPPRPTAKTPPLPKRGKPR